MDWRPTRRRLYSILYVGELASASWSVGELTGYHIAMYCQIKFSWYFTEIFVCLCSFSIVLAESFWISYCTILFLFSKTLPRQQSIGKKQKKQQQQNSWAIFPWFTDLYLSVKWSLLKLPKTLFGHFFLKSFK